MRELSLNEIGMVSGGKHDHLRGGGGGGFGGGGGIPVPIKAGMAGGAGTYTGNVLTGKTEFKLGDFVLATVAGGFGGAVGVPIAGNNGIIAGGFAGGTASSIITDTVSMAQSSGKVGSTSTNTSNDSNKTGDNYNVGHK